MISKSFSSIYNQYSQSKRLDKIVPILTGTLVYLIVVGTNTLRFENFEWLMQSEDPATHYTGWMFFRNSPWTFPLGANPDYGLEISSSIFYSDSLPLFAFVFKLLSPIFPSAFQYFGLWILLCFILQAWFAWRLVSLISTSMMIKFCATALFLFSPPLLARLYGHDTLAGHWLILAGLYLCLAKDIPHKKWKWLVLAVIASLVHSYLLAMVVLLWISDTIRRLVIHDLNPLSLLCEYLIVSGGILLSLWQVGFFMVKTGRSGSDYGQFPMNLFALVNPTSGVAGDIDWSFLMPALPTGINGFEGFNYLGLGMIGLFVIVIPYIFNNFRSIKFHLEWLPLVIFSAGCTLYAITNNITIGSKSFYVDLPDMILQIAGTLRASGRMFWPVYYLIYWCLIVLLLKAYRQRTAIILLAFVLLAQAVDTSAGWFPRRMTDTDSIWNSQLKSPDWEKIIPYYKKIRVFEPGRAGANYKEIAYLAAIHKLPTDSAYLARLDHDKYNGLYRYVAHAIQTGNYETDSLYIIIDPRYANYAKLRTDYSRDLFIELDGLAVVAPHWYEHTRNMKPDD